MHPIPIAEMLASLRAELRLAQQEAQGAGDLWFLVDRVELELQVVVSKTGDGKVSLSVPNVLELGGGGGATKETMQRIRLTLGPRASDRRKKVYAGDEGEL